MCAVFFLQEWRHAHGMRCLGIPNTAHFANVTQIEDAVARKYAVSGERRPPRAALSCRICFSSVGQAEVPEGVGAMAARHRGESASRLGRAAETALRGSHSCSNTSVSGGVRGLQWQRGQQEDLRGSEETGPAVDGRVCLGFFITSSFCLYSVISQPPPPFVYCCNR